MTELNSDNIFKSIDLSNFKTIEYLISNRSEIEFYSKTNKFNSGKKDCMIINEELICLYISLDKLVEECNFTEEQHSLIRLISIGYSFSEIHKLARKEFEAICREISSLEKQNLSNERSCDV